MAILKKRGRPRVSKPKNETYLLRLSEEDMLMLDYICEKEFLTRAEVLRRGIRMQYNLKKYAE